MQSKSKIPDWLLQEEEYSPKADRDGFMKKTMISIIHMLSHMKHETTQEKIGKTAPAIKIVGAVFVILLISLSRNMAFIWFMLVLLMVRMAVLDGESILNIVKRALIAMGISMLILLPGAFMGNWHTLVQVSSKILLTIMILGIEAETMAWNQLTAGLQIFHLPDVVIFILDITMKYIIQLGELCYSMLQALQARSVGKSRRKENWYFNILGVVFLKSREQSEEMVQAMECRGFDGRFMHLKKKSDWKSNISYILLLVVIMALFIWCNIM